MDGLSTRELYIIDRALAREYKATLDRRKKIQPSARAMMLADVKRVFDKVQAEIERREQD